MKVNFFILFIFFANSVAAVGSIEIESQSLSVLTEIGDDGDWNLALAKNKTQFMRLGSFVGAYEVAPRSLQLTSSLGSFSFSEGRVSSAVPTPVISYKAGIRGGVTYSMRPTLIISIGGFLEGGSGGKGLHAWVNEVDTKITEYEALHDPNTSEFVHMKINWESQKPIEIQVNELASYIKTFLKGVEYSWDILLAGHSRGGIFAHELSKELKNFNKISSLHVVLVDPTAVTMLSDRYPISVSNNTYDVYGSLFYDSKGFTFPLGFFTTGDLEISGYTNYGDYDFNKYDYGHSSIADELWIETELINILSYIFSKKEHGIFNSETDLRTIEVAVQSREFYLSGDVTFVDGNLSIEAYAQLGHLSSAVSIGAGEDGLSGGVSTMLTAAYMEINDSRLSANFSSLGSGASAYIDDEKFHTGTDSFIGLEAEANLEFDEVTVESVILPEVSVDLGLFEDIKDGELVEVSLNTGPLKIKLSCCKI